MQIFASCQSIWLVSFDIDNVNDREKKQVVLPHLHFLTCILFVFVFVFVFAFVFVFVFASRLIGSLPPSPLLHAWFCPSCAAWWRSVQVSYLSGSPWKSNTIANSGNRNNCISNLVLHGGAPKWRTL